MLSIRRSVGNAGANRMLECEQVAASAAQATTSTTDPQAPIDVQAVIAAETARKRAEALQVILAKGRVYTHASHYTILRVFSTYEETRLLYDAFDGNVVRRSGVRYVWTCGKLATLWYIREHTPDAVLRTRFKRLLDDERITERMQWYKDKQTQRNTEAA